MTHKKNVFLTFLWSLLPGAGEMYLGFMKQGLSLMTLFFGIIAFCAFFGFEAGLFVLPIVWFYSFFHVHNLNGLSDEKFSQVEDQFIPVFPDLSLFHMKRKKQLIFAWGCIIIGIYALWRMFVSLLASILPYAWRSLLYDFSGAIPQLFLSILLIVIGIRLILGKKAQLEEESSSDEDLFSTDFAGEPSSSDSRWLFPEETTGSDKPADFPAEISDPAAGFNAAAGSDPAVDFDDPNRIRDTDDPDSND